MNKNIVKYTKLFILIVFLVILDQCSKYMIVQHLGKTRAIPILKHVFSFEYLENRGVAFGILFGKKYLIMIIVLIVTILLAYALVILERGLSSLDTNLNNSDNLNRSGNLNRSRKSNSFGKSIDRGFYTHVRTKFTILQIICSFLIAGSIGNMIDRIRLGYVIDFIKLDFINFPTFNVADCYVTVAAFALLITVLFFIKDEDLDLIRIRK